MTANRHSGIRCALCWNENSAFLSRRHNNANMIALGERMMDLALAERIVEIFLTTDFEGGRHIPRIDKIELQG
jgi:ribose 5-phosphate isomerase B